MMVNGVDVLQIMKRWLHSPLQMNSYSAVVASSGRLFDVPALVYQTKSGGESSLCQAENEEILATHKPEPLTPKQEEDFELEKIAKAKIHPYSKLIFLSSPILPIASRTA